VAINYLKIRHISRRTGKCHSAHSQYRYISRIGGKEEDLVLSYSGNIPGWAKNESDFWRGADQYSRMDGKLGTEIVGPLPRELSRENNFALARNFQERLLGEKHPYTLAIHDKLAKDGKPNLHFHLLLSYTVNDGKERSGLQHFKQANHGGAPKVQLLNKMEDYDRVRSVWIKELNLALERDGHEIRFSSKARDREEIQKLEKKVESLQRTIDRQDMIHTVDDSQPVRGKNLRMTLGRGFSLGR
jgi:hypothetical protein